MKTLFLIHQNIPDIKFHTKIFDILFSHKNEICKKFYDIKGLYCLDHIAVTIFNPENEIAIFSITPSVEYNIIVQRLWKEDITFDPYTYADDKIIWWNSNKSSSYSQIKKIKEQFHGFTFGFNIYKKVENFKFIYSFATRIKDPQIRAYYINMKNELSLLGDYAYKLVRNIYLNYSEKYPPPIIHANNVKSRLFLLKLIV